MERNQSESDAPETRRAHTFRAPSEELVELFMRAARMATEEGLDHEDFMRGAWVSYVESRPDFRAKMMEMQMLAELADLRRRGHIPDA